MSHLRKRIFLLTDGAVSNPDAVISRIGQQSDSIRVFSFGLGSGCDASLVRRAAEAGRGMSTIVEDNATNLNGLVIRALSAAMEPSLRGARHGFNGALCPGKELYRNRLVCDVALMNQAAFSDLSYGFKAQSSESGEGIDLTYSKADFRKVEGLAAADLLKIAAQVEIDKTGDSGRQK